MLLTRVVTCFALMTFPAVAQTDEQVRAGALIGPMMQEVAPGRGGEIFTGCILAVATPDELATMAVAPAPSTVIGALLTAILARPETMACAQAAIQG